MRDVIGLIVAGVGVVLLFALYLWLGGDMPWQEDP